MKYCDIQKLHDAGFITDEQRHKIIEHFQLKEDGSGKFLAIVSLIGAVLIAAGIALLISAHWNEIPRGVKIAASLALMLGFHTGGWWLRGERFNEHTLSPTGGEGRGEGAPRVAGNVSGGRVRGNYRKTGEALHLIGSCLFLANIALIGQIYHIVSRPPDAFLLWWIGLAALPWLLRSKAQHVLLLIAFGIWFGFEVNEHGGLIYCESERQVLLYALLGLVYLGAGYCLRPTRFSDFAGVTERFGLIAFLIFVYPLTWKHFFGGENSGLHAWFFPALGLFALLLLAAGIRNMRALTAQWRWTWFAALLGMTVFMATVWFGCWQLDYIGGSRHNYIWGQSWSYLVGILALFVFCLLQIQVGLQERSPFLVNLGVVFVALDILAAYFNLFGSMERTGVMFLISGIFLIVFGVYLEKKRRKLMKQIKSSNPQEVP